MTLIPPFIQWFIPFWRGYQGHLPHDDDDNEEKDNEVEDKDDHNNEDDNDAKVIFALGLDRDLGFS